MLNKTGYGETMRGFSNVVLRENWAYNVGSNHFEYVQQEKNAVEQANISVG